MADTSDPQRPFWMRNLPIGLIALAAVFGALLLRDHLTFEALRDNREALIAFRDANYAVTALVFVLIYVLIVTFSLPGALVASLAGGFLFGVVHGSILNISAATVGATVIFLAARWGFGAQLAARMDAADGAVRRIKAGIDENQWSMLFVMRLVPVVPFFVANLVPALVGVPLRRFVVSTFFGIIPGGVVYTSVGAGLGEVFAQGQTPDLGIIFAPHILLPLLGLCFLALMPIAIKILRGKA